MLLLCLFPCSFRNNMLMTGAVVGRVEKNKEK